jgi:hypothetical protein
VGILTSYIENGTKLKSLKFGDGKFTSQPFIQTPMPSDSTVVTKPTTPLAAYADGVVRGALISVQRSARDVVRLTKYMATPSGVQFTLKQNLLSRVAVGTETSGFFNEAIYTPLSTLAQAGVGILGIHLNKQGLLPVGRLSLKKYGSTVYNLNLNDPNKYTDNRLVDLHFESIENPTLFSPTILYKYKGGPGSILGIGSTKIRYATEGDGMIPLRVMGSNNLDPKTYLVPKGGDKNFAPSIDDNTFQQSLRDKFTSILGASAKYDLYSKTIGATIASTIAKSKNNLDWLVNSKSTYSVYSSGSFQPFTNLSNYLVPGTAGSGLSISDNETDRRLLALSAYTSSINYRLEHAGSGRQIVDKLIRPYTTPLDISPKISGYKEYSSANTINVDKPSSDAKPIDKYVSLNQQTGSYLANLNKNVGYYPDTNGKLIYDNSVFETNHGIGPDFRLVNRDVRGFGDVKLLNKYHDHVTTNSDYFSPKRQTVDQIYYTSNKKRTSTEFGSTNDLIEFSISIVSPTNSNDPEKLTFRAYIDNISDTYSPDWSSQTYMGRGEKFHKYNSFDRKISLGFTVAAESKDHLIAMYNRLNQLAASLAPTYTDQGYMAGNIHKLNVGNYIANQYGIINGLTYEIMEESPWSIQSNFQLPMYIKVTGFQFTPIHDFRPEYFPTVGKNQSNAFINAEYKQQRGV